MQAQQLADKSQKLDAKDAALQRDLQILASENAQLASAQLAVQSAAASNQQLSTDLAEERDALSKQLRSLNVREAELQTKMEECDRTLQVSACLLKSIQCTTRLSAPTCTLRLWKRLLTVSGLYGHS